VRNFVIPFPDQADEADKHSREGPLGTNKRQAYQLALIVLAFVTLVAWCMQTGRADVIWALRLGAPLLAAAVGWWFYKAAHRPENFEDLLTKVAPRYLERDGLCFMPVIDAANEAGRVSIYFQNRFAGHATGRIEMRPPLRSFWFGRHALPTIAAQVECPGGAFGVLRLPFAIPAKYQGRRMQFNIGADVKYPAKRGQLLRFRSGKRVLSRKQLDGSPAGAVLALVFLSLPLAALSAGSRGTRLRLKLPTGVAENVPPVIPQLEILHTPDLPTAGFPVLPLSRAA